MLTKGALAESFKVYFDEMERCRTAGTYWALLHITVCLPDICAALQSPSGDSTSEKYKRWCQQYATDPALTSDERWDMRNRVLHQGHGRTGTAGRYSAYSFGQPATSGSVDHKRFDGSVLHLDVGEFARETRLAVEKWIAQIESSPSSQEARAVEKNLPSLVRVKVTSVVYMTSVINVIKTY